MYMATHISADITNEHSLFLQNSDSALCRYGSLGGPLLPNEHNTLDKNSLSFCQRDPELDSEGVKIDFIRHYYNKEKET